MMLFIDFKTLSSLSDFDVYNSKLASKSIILVKKSKDPQLIEESKLVLFKLLSNIVVKNVDNFFYLIRNYNNFHSKDDLVSEAFIVFNKCLKSFDIKRNKEFYFYYNKSLTRAFLRLAEKHYFKHRHCGRLNDFNQKNISVSENLNDNFIGFYLNIFNLDEIEREILKSRMNKEKLKDFLERNKSMTSANYFKILSRIKIKLKDLKEEEND